MMFGNLARCVTVFLFLTSTACSSGDGNSSKETIRIGGPANISMLVIIAENEGYFDDFDFGVTYEHVQTGKITQDALISNDLDLGIIVDSNIAYMSFYEDNVVDAIASIMKKTDDGLVVRADRDINKPSDLRGKTVGYLPATTSHVFLNRFLALHGLRESNLELLEMTPPAMQAAIIRGDVDAISVWQPFRYNVQLELGAAAAIMNDPSVYVAQSLLAAKSRFLEKHEEKIPSILSAIVAAEAYVRENPETAQEVIADRLGISISALKASWHEYELRVSLDSELLDLLVSEGAWIESTQSGFAGKEIPDYSDAIEPRFLEKVDPARVTLFE